MIATDTTPRSVDLPIDADGAYAFLTDLEFLPTWYPGIASISGAPSDGPVKGTRFVEHRRLAPGVSVPVGLRVTAAVPGRRFQVVADRPGVGAIEGRYDITRISDRAARVTVSHRIDPARLVLAPVAHVARLVLMRGNAQQIAAMPGGLARWRAETTEQS